jgi:transcriptional regulator with XRE-family HTH domain
MNLKEYLKEKEITAKDFAKIIDTSEKTVFNILHKKVEGRNIRLETYFKIKIATNSSVEVSSIMEHKDYVNALFKTQERRKEYEKNENR